MSACIECGATISRYAPTGSRHCALHDKPYATHIDAAYDLAPRTPGYCKHGHDLSLTGFLRNAGGGRVTRKCRACHNARQRAYRLRSAA